MPKKVVVIQRSIIGGFLFIDRKGVHVARFNWEETERALIQMDCSEEKIRKISELSPGESILLEDA